MLDRIGTFALALRRTTHAAFEEGLVWATALPELHRVFCKRRNCPASKPSEQLACVRATFRDLQTRVEFLEHSHDEQTKDSERRATLLGWLRDQLIAQRDLDRIDTAELAAVIDDGLIPGLNRSLPLPDWRARAELASRIAEHLKETVDLARAEVAMLFDTPADVLGLKIREVVQLLEIAQGWYRETVNAAGSAVRYPVDVDETVKFCFDCTHAESMRSFGPRSFCAGCKWIPLIGVRGTDDKWEDARAPAAVVRPTSQVDDPGEVLEK